MGKYSRVQTNRACPWSEWTLACCLWTGGTRWMEAFSSFSFSEAVFWAVYRSAVFQRTDVQVFIVCFIVHLLYWAADFLLLWKTFQINEKQTLLHKNIRLFPQTCSATLPPPTVVFLFCTLYLQITSCNNTTFWSEIRKITRWSHRISKIIITINIFRIKERLLYWILFTVYTTPTSWPPAAPPEISWWSFSFFNKSRGSKDRKCRVWWRLWSRICDFRLY